MSHDHEAVRLAVASLDFELSPDERRRMETGLEACEECAAIAASHVGFQSLLARLPVHDASPLVRQRVLRASLVTPRSRPWPVLLVAAALIGLLLAGGAAAIGAFRTDPLDPAVDLTRASPPASDRPSPPAEASAIVDPTPEERILLSAIPGELLAGCIRSRTVASDPAITGDVAGIDCPVDDADVTESRYFLFAAPAELTGWWQSGIRDMGLQPDSGGCLDGRAGETTFDAGRMQCFVAPGGARLRWSDDARLIYGVVVSSSQDLRATVDWWRATHGTDGVRESPAFLPAEQTLVDEAPADIAADCIPYRIVGAAATTVEGSVAAIDCPRESGPLVDVGYFRFPSVSALDEWWAGRLAALPISADSDGCRDGSPGERETSRGRIACYVADGEARIRWIDRDRLVYGVLNGRTSNLARLWDWWVERHDD
jgi:anti-sigma factor RsiW